MNKLKKLLLAVGALIALNTGIAFASGDELAYFKLQKLETLLSASIASGDYIPVYDASANKIKKVDATAVPLGGAFNGTVGAVTPAAGAFTTLDGTDLEILTGDITIGNGTPTLTQNGEDFYVEGTLEADGNANLGGTLTVVGATILGGDLSGDGGDQIVGFLRNQVAATATTITAAQCGTTFISGGAIEMELPEASTVLGCRLTFVVNNASNFTIDPDAADIIQIATNAAGDSLIADLPGESITLEAISATQWAVIGTPYGTWTDSN